MNNPPFKEDDIVRVKGEDHLGLFAVDECEWYPRYCQAGSGYWLCRCTGIREPIDWSKYPPGTTGIVARTGWQGSADNLEASAIAPAEGKTPS